jgi:GNAT superfamily N-acetyltransferase
VQTIRNAETPAEIEHCFAVMTQLRPHLQREEFMPRVQRQMTDGYRLAYLSVDNLVKAVAGYRLLENLAWGRFLYVDDLVTAEAARSQGYGKDLLAWLAEHARQNGCAQLHLDSGAQRQDAHRFYLREAMVNTGFHFVMKLDRDNSKK